MPDQKIPGPKRGKASKRGPGKITSDVIHPFGTNAYRRRNIWKLAITEITEWSAKNRMGMMDLALLQASKGDWGLDNIAMRTGKSSREVATWLHVAVKGCILAGLGIKQTAVATNRTESTIKRLIPAQGPIGWEDELERRLAKTMMWYHQMATWRLLEEPEPKLSIKKIFVDGKEVHEYDTPRKITYMEITEYIDTQALLKGREKGYWRIDGDNLMVIIPEDQ